MLGTCPDISYAVIKMAQFASNPSLGHMNKAKQIICYLRSSPDLSLVFDDSSDKGIIAFCNSDWASDKIKHKSQTGYFFQLAGASISWQSCAQKTIALSSTEAEYMALCDCCKQAKWIKTLLSKLGINVRHIPVNGDNQGSIFLGSNPVQGNRSKHIDIWYHFVWQCIEDKEAKLYFVEGAENPANMFTKVLGHIKFSKFKGQLGFENKWLLIQLNANVEIGEN